MSNEINELNNQFNTIISRIEEGTLPLTTLDSSFVETYLSFISHCGFFSSHYYAKSLNDYSSKIRENLEIGNLEVVLGMINAVHMLNPATCTLIDDIRTHEIYRYMVFSQMVYFYNLQRNNFWKSTHHFNSKEHFLGRGVIYSAIIGKYDKLNEPEYVNPKFDYILFTDNPDIQSNTWKIHLVTNDGTLDNTRLARKIKIQGYKFLSQYDYSIWVDGKILITGDINEYVNKYKSDCSMLAIPHYANNCAYSDAETCISLNKGNKQEILDQMDAYKKEGFPEQYGLIDSCVLVRELKDSALNSIMDTWWNEILTRSYRDQLSVCYSFWKNDSIFDMANINLTFNPYFSLTNHI